MGLFSRIGAFGRRAWAAISPAPVFNHIAVVNASARPDADIAFWIKACEIALRERFWKAWPDLPKWTIGFYRHGEGMVPAKSHVILILDTGGDKDRGAIALHYITAGNEIGGRVYLDRGDDPSGSLSHEVFELAGNPRIDKWVSVPRGFMDGDPDRIAGETSDPVQMGWDEISVTIGSETRRVRIQDFVHPSWFDPNGKWPFSEFRHAVGPFDTRWGYAVVEKDGVRDYIWGEKSARPMDDDDPLGRAARAKKQ